MATKRRVRLLASTLVAGIVFLGALIESASAATPFAMSGLHRHWCCNTVVVPDGVLPTPTFPSGTLTITGDDAAFPVGAVVITQIRPGLPEGAAAGDPFSGVVSQTGLPMTPNNPATLTLLPNAFSLTNMFTNPSAGATFTYIRTTASFMNAQATLRAGGGPGTQHFCRVAGGVPAHTPCTAPPGIGLVGDPNFPWQINMMPGANQFGGTLEILGFLKGIAKFKPPELGGANRNVYFSQPTLAGAPLTANINPLQNIIKFTSAGSPLSVTLPTPSGGTIMATQVPNVSYQTGAPFTTGTVSVIATQVTSPFLYQRAVVSGYDNRTANGQGNIQLVTPIAFTNTGSNNGFPQVKRLTLELPEPGSALALAAGTAALLGLAWLRRSG